MPDALTAIATMGARTSTIEIGTAVIPTWPRHPLMLAAQALTVQEAIGNRLALGIGLAHKSSVESTLKIPFVTPAKHMDEYLSVLLPGDDGPGGHLHRRHLVGRGRCGGWRAGAAAPTVLLAAMGPRMLRLAGERTDGLDPVAQRAEGHRPADQDRRSTRPRPRRARPSPRIVASVPVCVTKKPDEVRAVIADVLVGYNDLPSYRGVMDAEGADGPADVSVVGNEDEVRAGLAAFADAGATDFAALEFFTDADEITATRALLRQAASE